MQKLILDESLLKEYKRYVDELFDYAQSKKMADILGIWESYRKHAGYYHALENRLYTSPLFDVYMLTTTKLAKARDDARKYREIFHSKA